MTILSESRLRGRDLVAERRRTEEQIQQQDQLLCTEEQEAAHSLLRLGRNLPPVIRNEAGFDYDYQPSRRIPSEVVVPPLLTPNAERIPVEQQHYQQERHRCQNHGGEKEHRQSRRSTGGKRSSRRNRKRSSSNDGNSESEKENHEKGKFSRKDRDKYRKDQQSDKDSSDNIT